MVKMLGFSSKSLPSIDNLTEEEDLWFKSMLTHEFLERNIHYLSLTLSLSSVKNRKGYYFDDVHEKIKKT